MGEQKPVWDLGCPIHREYELWGHSTWYDEKCGNCVNIIQIGKRKFCGLTPPRCTIHQCVRDQIGCIFCKNYTKRLDCVACMACLEANEGVSAEEMIRRNKEIYDNN